MRLYYESLKRKRLSLILKRGFDFAMSLFLLIFLSPVMIGLSIAIVADSKGGVFFRQERITQYGRKFEYMFRTMVADAENIGSRND